MHCHIFAIESVCGIEIKTILGSLFRSTAEFCCGDFSA